MTKLAKRCSADASRIPTEHFCALLDSIVLMLQSMGSMMSSAFSDVAEKSVIMRKNKAFMIEKFGREAMYLNETIDEEL